MTTEALIDLNTPGVHAQPFPIYANLRENNPICKVDPGGMWAISRYADVVQAFHRHDVFSSSGFEQWLQPAWLNPECFRGGFLILEDQPSHTRNRAIIKEAFTTKAVKALVPLMRQSAESLVLRLSSGHPVNFQATFAYPYLGVVLSRLTGIGHDEIPEELRYGAELMEVMPLTTPSQAFIDTIEAAFLRQNQLFDEIVRYKRLNPGPDLLTTLINARIDGQPLPHSLLVHAMGALIGAGYQTPVHLLSSLVVQLSRHPDMMGLLSARPDLIPAFVDEVQRLAPISHGQLRRTTRDVELHGTTIPENELVYLLTAAANRDPHQFENPDVMDLSRANAHTHLGFGYGIHLCIGKTLVREQVRIALEILVNKFSAVHCPGDDELDYIDSFIVFGFKELPATFYR